MKLFLPIIVKIRKTDLIIYRIQNSQYQGYLMEITNPKRKFRILSRIKIIKRDPFTRIFSFEDKIFIIEAAERFVGNNIQKSNIQHIVTLKGRRFLYREYIFRDRERPIFKIDQYRKLRVRKTIFF